MSLTPLIRSLAGRYLRTWRRTPSITTTTQTEAAHIPLNQTARIVPISLGSTNSNFNPDDTEDLQMVLGLPKSLTMLTYNDVSVPPRRLLQDLNWDIIARSPNFEHKEELNTLLSNLKGYDERGINVTPVLAKEYMQKFVCWLALLSNVEEKKITNHLVSIDGVLQGDFQEIFTTLQKLEALVNQALANQKYDLAYDYAENLINKCRGFRMRCKKESEKFKIKAEEEKKHAFLYGVGAGCAATVGFLHFPNNADASKLGLKMAATGLSGLCVAISLHEGYKSWFLSEECRAYYDAAMARMQVFNESYNRMDKLITELLFLKPKIWETFSSTTCDAHDIV